MPDATPHPSKPSTTKLLKELDPTASPEQQLEQMKRYFAADLQQARQQLAESTRELAAYEAMLAKVPDPKQDQDIHYLMNQVELMALVHQATRRLSEIQVACDEHNLKALEKATPQRALNLKVPHEDPEFLELFHLRGLSMSAFLVAQFIDGIDVVQRAVTGSAVAPKGTPQEEKVKRELAEALKAAAAAEPELAKQVNHLSSEFTVTLPLLEWGRSAWRSSRTDGDWEKLNGIVHFLSLLPQKVAGFPQLAELFPPAEG